MTPWICSRVSGVIGWAISLNSPSGVLRLGMATNSPFCPSIILMSLTTKELSKVIEAIAAHLALGIHPLYPDISNIQDPTPFLGCRI